MNTRELVAEETVFNGVVFNVIARDYVAGDDLAADGVFVRQVVASAPVVHVLTVTREKEFIMVKEFREGTSQETFGFPAGTIDPGEIPEKAARREVEEEIGMKIVQLISLGSGPSSEGIMTEIAHFFFAVVEPIPNKERKYFADKDEGISVHRMTWSEVVELYRRNLIGAKNRFLVQSYNNVDLKRRLGKRVSQLKEKNNTLNENNKKLQRMNDKNNGLYMALELKYNDLLAEHEKLQKELADLQKSSENREEDASKPEKVIRRHVRV